MITNGTNRGFDFICKTYEEKLKFLCQELQEKCNGKSLSKHEIALEDFIISSIDRSKMASMIYSIYRNDGKGIGFSKGKPNEISLKACCECIKEGLKTFFVPEGVLSLKLLFSQNLKLPTLRLRSFQIQRTLSSRPWQTLILKLQRSIFWRDQNLFLKFRWNQSLVSWSLSFRRTKQLLLLGNQNQKVLNLRYWLTRSNQTYNTRYKKWRVKVLLLTSKDP